MTQFQVLIGNYKNSDEDTYIGIFNSQEAVLQGKQMFLDIQADKAEYWNFHVETYELNTVYYEDISTMS